jgi:adenylate kinase family enzyme
MKYKYVFLLGRPGCGKSALYRELEQRIRASGQAKTFERIDDFPILWAKLQADDALEQEGQERLFSRRIGKGDYRITNYNVLHNVFNEILQEVNSDVLKIDQPDHMIFLEFARPSYVEALQHFDQRILDRCIAIYMDVNFDICWARNVARHVAAIAQDGDDHLVPRAEMERIYLHDDRDAFVRHMQERNVPVLVVNNEAEGEEHLKQQVEELFKHLFQADPGAPLPGIFDSVDAPDQACA